MARLAYVILAHNEPINLFGFISSVWNREDVFHIWVDGKADPDFRNFANTLALMADNVQAHPAMMMTWGGFSIVATTLRAYGRLRKETEDFSHVVLCSGTHIPLLHADQIYKEIKADYGRMDLCSIAVPGKWDCLPQGWARDILTRVRYHYQEVPPVGMLPVREREHWIEPNFLEGSQ